MSNVVKVKCKKNPHHLIATVDINKTGFIPRGLPLDVNPEIRGPRHGLSWDYSPEGHSRVRATCPKSRCTYDASCDYEWLRDELAKAAAAAPPGVSAEYVLKI